jgi:hypothetical protein
MTAERVWLAAETVAGYLGLPWSARYWLVMRAARSVRYRMESMPIVEERPF